MNYRFPISGIFFFLVLYMSLQGQRYYPDKGNDKWLRKDPSTLNMDPTAIDSAVAYAMAHEVSTDTNLTVYHYQSFGREPFGDAIGPHKNRGPQTGIILKDGYIIAEWGQPDRVDMTHSITKSFLSSTAGIAYDQGLIDDIHTPVGQAIGPIFLYGQDKRNKADQLYESQVFEPFKSSHNSKITWDHLLRQTSDWEGILWGKPDWADRPGDNPKEWINRLRKEPGTSYEYNDTRVNLLALALTNIWQKPLQAVLKEHIMDPIGASTTWNWMGYDNSWIIIGGQAIQVPSGGGHWGGGMFINAYDQARFGYLTLNRGKWKNTQLLSEKWVSMSLTPTEVQNDYGFMNWFLNTDKKRLPSAPESAFFHLGAGVNMVYVDPQNDIVIVARWLEGKAMDGLVERVLKALR